MSVWLYLRPQKVSSISMKFCLLVKVDEQCTMVMHTIVHYSSTSTYKPNFIEIEETFCGRTDVSTTRRTFEYDLIQGQGQGHEPFKVGNASIFKSYLHRHLQWEMATDH